MKAKICQRTGHAAIRIVHSSEEPGSVQHNTLYAPTRASRLASAAAVQFLHAAITGHVQPIRLTAGHLVALLLTLSAR